MRSSTARANRNRWERSEGRRYGMRESRVIALDEVLGMVTVRLRGKAKRNGTFSLRIRDGAMISVKVKEGDTAGRIAQRWRRKAKRAGEAIR
jgi:phage tail sheath gpL-like